MCLVPKRCNDMMNLGRLQGFEVCICILLIIPTRQGKVFYPSMIVSTICPTPGCFHSACSSPVLSCMLWWCFKGAGDIPLTLNLWQSIVSSKCEVCKSFCKFELHFLYRLPEQNKWWTRLLCLLVRSPNINVLTAPSDFGNIQERACEL